MIAWYTKYRKPYICKDVCLNSFMSLDKHRLSSRSGHVKPWLNPGGPPPKAKYILRSIVNKYREGKVKRTPEGEWNRTWNCVRTRSRSTFGCDGVLFVERSNELLVCASLSHMTEAQRKRVWIGRIVHINRPETRWPNHGQVEAQVKLRGGPNRRVLQHSRMTCG